MIKYHPDEAFVAYWRGNKIGQVLINVYDKSLGQDVRHIHKSAILNGFRRMGVATKLYDAADAWLRQRGLRLVPSPQGTLSDDAFKFWNKRDPTSVAQDARHSQAQYGGKIVTYQGEEWVIKKVGAKYAPVSKNDDSGITTFVPSNIVYAQLGPPHSIITESAAVRLLDLYDKDELDDPREQLHLYVDDADLHKDFIVHEMSPLDAKTYVTPYDDTTVFAAFKQFAHRDQKRLVREKAKNFDSSRIIIVINKTVLDGNHHLMAGILAGQPIKYINLAD